MGKVIWVLGVPIRTYALLYGLGTAAAFLGVLPALSRWRGVPWRRLLFPVAVAVAVGWVAAHLAFSMINVRPLGAMLRHMVLKFNEGNEGIAGFVGGLLTYFWILRKVAPRWGIVAADANDALAPALAFMIIPFKLGCLFGGCCHGRPAGAFWGSWAVSYPPGTGAYRQHLRAGLIAKGAAESLPTLPAQTLEMLAMALVTGALVWAYRKRWLRGRLIFAFFLAYGVWRNVSELWLRGDFGRGEVGPFSATQLMTFPIVAWSAWAIWAGKRPHEARAPAADRVSEGA